jgi:hypothetical protein
MPESMSSTVAADLDAMSPERRDPIMGGREGFGAKRGLRLLHGPLDVRIRPLNRVRNRSVSPAPAGLFF